MIRPAQHERGTARDRPCSTHPEPAEGREAFALMDSPQSETVFTVYFSSYPAHSAVRDVRPVLLVGWCCPFGRAVGTVHGLPDRGSMRPTRRPRRTGRTRLRFALGAKPHSPRQSCAVGKRSKICIRLVVTRPVDGCFDLSIRSICYRWADGRGLELRKLP